MPKKLSRGKSLRRALGTYEGLWDKENEHVMRRCHRHVPVLKARVYLGE